MVIIKPTKDATYKNTVDILNEMTIDAVKRYALVDISPTEYGYITKTEAANGGKITGRPVWNLLKYESICGWRGFFSRGAHCPKARG